MKNYIIIAHRGITEIGYDDNSFESLLEIQNINSNFNLGIEFDIQLTSDNKIVIYHDEYLDTTLENQKSVEKSTYSEIIKINNKIIQIEDILKEFNNTSYILNIELKCYSNNYKLEIYVNTIINILYKYNINYMLTSFDSNIIDLLYKKNISNIYLISEELDKVNTSITNYKLYNKFDNIIGIYTLYDKDFDEKILLKVLKSNIEILITDNVEKLNNYLMEYLYKD